MLFFTQIPELGCKMNGKNSSNQNSSTKKNNGPNFFATPGGRNGPKAAPLHPQRKLPSARTGHRVRRHGFLRHGRYHRRIWRPMDWRHGVGWPFKERLRCLQNVIRWSLEKTTNKKVHAMSIHQSTLLFFSNKNLWKKNGIFFLNKNKSQMFFVAFPRRFVVWSPLKPLIWSCLNWFLCKSSASRIGDDSEIPRPITVWMYKTPYEINYQPQQVFSPDFFPSTKKYHILSSSEQWKTTSADKKK